MSTLANTANDPASVDDENVKRFRETFSRYWREANDIMDEVTKNGEIKRANAQCPYASSLTTHQHVVLNTSFARQRKRCSLGSSAVANECFLRAAVVVNDCSQSSTLSRERMLPGRGSSAGRHHFSLAPTVLLHLHKTSRLTSNSIDQKVVPVTVGTGNNKQTFYVHEPLLKMHSPFFRACLSRNWAEGNKHSIELPEDDPKVVTLFLRFLYTGQIHIIEHDTLLWSKTTDGSFHRPDIAGDLLMHSYIFADKYLADPFRNACILALIERFESSPEYALALRQNADLLYTNLSPASPLRRLYLDVWVWAATPEWHDDGGNEFHDIHTAPVEFWQDISKAHAQKKVDFLLLIPPCKDIDRYYPWNQDRSQYFQGLLTPEPHFPRPFAEDVDFASLSLQPEPSGD
ncbi:uncharacterized protein IWZ02DRAFT_428975 [Phyllosticta citriasiana]|uniref:uncharacterized protein n=1 Tax=Phyllosticta citriasiana TaxID=595635 RepID=UPI0030FDAF4F